MSMSRDNLVKACCIIIFFCPITVALCYPLAFKGYLYGHDSPSHVLWAQQFLKSLQSGLLYPQWVADANLGCGNATFIFYPPLSLYSYALIHLFTEEVLPILSISIFLGMMVSGVTMYVFCRTYLARFGALLASIAYMALPYHLVDLYARSALAEFWAFVWVPLICYCVAKVRGNPGLYSAGLSLSYAGLVLTHLPTALLFSPFFISYIFLLHYEERNRKLFLYRLFATVIGLCLSSFYLIPAIAEKHFVNITALTNDAWYRVSHNFLFSHKAYDMAFNKLLSNTAISTSVIAVVALFYCIYRHRKTYKSILSPESFFHLAALVSFFMMLSFSRPLWENLPFLRQVQFPWRLLTITTFFASLSLGFLSEDFLSGVYPLKRWGTLLQGLLIAGLIIWNGWNCFGVIDSFKGVSFDSVKTLKNRNLSIRADDSYEEMRKNYNIYFVGNLWLSDVIEYRPLWSLQKVIPTFSPEGDTKKDLQDYLGFVSKKIAESPETDFSLDEAIFFERHGSYVLFPPLKILYSIRKTGAAVAIPYEMLKEDILFSKGSGTAEIVKWEPEKRKIHVKTATPGQILYKTFYYPRWKATTNGIQLPVSSEHFTGLLEIEVPQGEYDIELRFEAGIYRLIGILISIFSAGIILMLPFKNKLKTRSTA